MKIDGGTWRRITRVVQYVERLMNRGGPSRRVPRERESFSFQLTTGLTAGGSATANRIEWSNATNSWAPVQTGITVHDDLYGNLEAGAGARGRFFFTGPDRRCIETVRC